MLPSIESSSSKELITTPSSSMSTQSPIVYAQDESSNNTPPVPQLAATDTDKDNLIKSAAKRSIQFTEHDLMNKGSENEVELTYGTKVQDVKRNKHETYQPCRKQHRKSQLHCLLPKISYSVAVIVLLESKL
ncbi:uncharacterized protein LOC100821594 isoform X1 [Brachypodium distachyon]|uniref:Uncharacterized protein n=2 Tax=Brachypodium distachyon TaxID=15368 RepID=A0A2K2D8K7_BRADI|nr:uncharacterized protein LOC100821594 isoform X1 [Brachypodium distachyon]PNT70616.1 hypothetical protein BRADI_2g14492v3 [Brachypodium distachyon]|eukprot:XP_003565813.1 uncharacterized protein LOC100821594 isoform X1 [Brachypodium distachyon]